MFAFGFETCIKTILMPLINRLISEALLVADHVSIRCCFSSLTSLTAWFLIKIFLRIGFSRCLQALAQWCGFHAARGEKMNDAYYCDVLLQKQLLPDICQAVGDFCIPAHRGWARAVSCCCDTRLRTSHQTWPSNRPDLSSVDY